MGNKPFHRAAWLGLAAGLLLAGCTGPAIDVDLDSAKETFKKRQLSNANPAAEVQAAAVSPVADDRRARLNEGDRRRLVQFRYGDASLADPLFSQYLRSHVASLSGAGSAKDRSANWSPEEKQARRRLLILEEMRIMREDLQPYGAPVRAAADQLPASQVNYRGAPVGNVFTSLAEKAAIPIQLSEGVRRSKSRVSGAFYGDPIEVMDQVARAQRLAVRAEQSGGMFHLFLQTELDQRPSLAKGLYDPFSSVALSNAEFQVVAQYRYLVSLLESGDEGQFRRQLLAVRPPQVGVSATQAYESLSRGAMRLYSLLRQFDQGMLGENDHPSLSVAASRPGARVGGVPDAILSLGRLEPSLCVGHEVATEKVAVLYELPSNIKTHLETYFKSVNAAAPNAAAPAAGTPGTPGAAGTAAPGAPAVGTPPAVTPPAQVAPAATPGQVTPGAAPTAAAAPGTTGCALAKPAFRVIDDPTGVVVSGSPYELDLAYRLIQERDIPSRQVLAEVFLVEVQKDWERVIEASIRGSRANAGTVSSLFTALTDSSAGLAGIQGKVISNSSDIIAFINMLESNSVGRNISSPTIIARDGEKAELEKKVQLRKKIIKSTSTSSAGGISTTTDERIDSLEVPLKLSITPKVNRHNNHVVLLFEYDETILSAEAADSPIEKSTTQNKIKTNVETAPGDVVILAGLFKESNNRANSALPGFSGLGILTPLAGGSHNRSTSSSELLVFIKPTVVEPKAFTAQVNSLR